MVNVHGQNNKKKKDEITEEKNKSQTEKILKVLTEEMNDVRNIIYDSISTSSLIASMSVPGHIFDNAVDDLATNIIEGIYENDYVILDRNALGKIESDLKKYIHISEGLDKIIEGELEKRGEYLITVLNDLLKVSNMINEDNWNQFSLFNDEQKALKMKEEEPLLVYSRNEDNQYGISVFSMISTISNFLIGKRISHVIDDETGDVLGITWHKNLKGEVLTQKLNEITLDINDKNISGKITQLIDLTKQSIQELNKED